MFICLLETLFDLEQAEIVIMSSGSFRITCVLYPHIPEPLYYAAKLSAETRNGKTFGITDARDSILWPARVTVIVTDLIR